MSGLKGVHCSVDITTLEWVDLYCLKHIQREVYLIQGWTYSKLSELSGLLIKHPTKRTI